MVHLGVGLVGLVDFLSELFFLQQVSSRFFIFGVGQVPLILFGFGTTRLVLKYVKIVAGLTHSIRSVYLCHKFLTRRSPEHSLIKIFNIKKVSLRTTQYSLIII